MAKEVFRIMPDGFKEIRKLILLRAIPTSLLGVGGGLLIFQFINNAQQNDGSIYTFIIPLALGAMAVGIFSSIKRQKALWDSYSLTIDEGTVIREMLNTPAITLTSAEIHEIIKNPDGSFAIIGNSSLNVIGVPSQIDNYSRLEYLLQNIKPISVRSKEPFLKKFRSLFSILMVSLMAALFISNDKLIVGISGTIILGLLGYSLFEVQRSKNIDSKTKRARWWLLVVFASILGIMYFKIH